MKLQLEWLRVLCIQIKIVNVADVSSPDVMKNCLYNLQMYDRANGEAMEREAMACQYVCVALVCVCVCVCVCVYVCVCGPCVCGPCV